MGRPHRARGGHGDQSDVDAPQVLEHLLLVAAGVRNLATGHQPDDSPWGIAYLALTAVVMFGLAAAKLRTSRTIDDHPLVHEARVTFLDGTLAVGILLALVLNAAFRADGKQFIAEDNAFAIPSARFIDAGVSYTRKRVRITVFGDNLLDEESYTRGFASYSVMPVPTRRCSVRIDVR